MSTKSIKSIKPTDTSRVSARTYRARRIGVGVCAILAAVCLWLLGANWGMARVEQVAQADQATPTSTSTSHVRDVERQTVPTPKSSEAQAQPEVTQAQTGEQAQPVQPSASQAQAQPQAQAQAQPTDVQAYQSWLASLPQSLDDIPACLTETGEDIDAETADVTVYMPVCRWDAAISGNGQGESYVLAYGHKVMPLNYR